MQPTIAPTICRKRLKAFALNHKVTKELLNKFYFTQICMYKNRL